MVIRAGTSGTKRSLVHDSPFAALGLFLVIAAAHAAGSVLAYEVNNVTSQGVSLFPAAGVTVAALLLVERRSWSIVLWSTFLAEFVANIYLIGEVFGTAFGSALSNVAEPALGAALVLHWLGRSPLLQRQRDLLAFFVGAVLCGPVLGTLVGVTSTRLTPGHSAFFDVAGRWFVGDGLGVLVVGTLILAWAKPDVTAPRTLRVGLEATALAITLVLVTWLAFWGTAPALAYATLPALGWASLRFGVRGATAGGAIVASLADWATLSDHGLFFELSRSDPDTALWQLQLFLGVLMLTSLMLAAQVSEREATSRALRAAEATRRFRKLLEASPDPIVIVRVDGSIEFVNRQFQQLIGSAEHDLLGTQLVDLLPEYSRETAEAAFAAAALAPGDTRTEFELMSLGGPGRAFETAVSPLSTGSERVLVATMREVTERRRAEEATLRALTAAEQATRAKSEFLAMMSHEIRTPMNGVIGMVDILGRMSLEVEQRHIVGTIAESAEALLSVINDILDFSKIEAGKLTIEAASFDLRDLVDGVAEVLSTSAAAKSVELSSVVAADVPQFVVGDSMRLRQVVYNLLGNAVKFTGEGSVRLSVEATATEILLSVVDSGIGMTAEQREHLFEPFVQAEQSTTRRFGGSGLGLAIVWRLVELMDGTITVDSTLDRGSTFTVRVPMPTAEPIENVPGPLRGLRVLTLASSQHSPSVDVAGPALLMAGAEVSVSPAQDRLADVARRAGADYDVLYVTRDVQGISPDATLDELVRAVAGSGRAVVVCDRTVGGASWLPHATPVATSALTGRTVVRAVSLASGRVPGSEAVLSSTSDARTVAPDGPRVLVAEDHPTNRIVIRRQLTLLGVDCEIADDGAEALDMLAQQNFALLLADCHMPKLDGYELARRIRRAELGTGTHLPIVALTASALPSEADRCLAAGMDLVLTKPISLEALDRALAPWLRPEDSTTHEMTATVVDLSVLHDLLGGDPVAVQEVTATFVTSAAESLAELNRADAARDFAAVRAAAHRLLGGARTMGASGLADLCEQLESSRGEPEHSLLIRLRAELEAVLGTLDAQRRGGGSSSGD